MAPSPPAIEVQGDEATIEAGFLVAKLGLLVGLLRAEMCRGIVYGVVERGTGEDAARLRPSGKRLRGKDDRRRAPGLRLACQMAPDGIGHLAEHQPPGSGCGR